MFGRSVEYDPRISKITRQLAAIESSSRTLGGSAGCKAWAGTSNARNILNLSHTWQHVNSLPARMAVPSRLKSIAHCAPIGSIESYNKIALAVAKLARYAEEIERDKLRTAAVQKAQGAIIDRF